jgi:hypothetical protein
MQFGSGEWTAPQRVYGWDAQATLSNVRATLSGRLMLGNLIRGLIVQWGLIGFFLPPNPNYVPQKDVGESHFLNLFNEKQWTTQSLVLQAQVDDPSLVLQPDVWVANRTLSPTIPVFVVSAPQNATDSCVRQKLALDSNECKVMQLQAQLDEQFNAAMASITPGGTVARCNFCNGFVVDNPNLPWLVDTIMDLAGNITIPL